MLTPEQYHIITGHMRHSMMNKALHVHYTAQKCFRLREGLVSTATHFREDASLLVSLQNRQYRLVRSISADEDGRRHTLHARQLLALAREQYGLTGMLQQQLSEVAAGLMRPADTLLFTLLKAQHYQWRDRLYMSLLAESPDQVLSDEDACPLGQWLNAEGRRRFFTLPGFRALQAAHHQMHLAAAALFDHPLSELLPGVLNGKLQQTEYASQSLISALDGLDQSVGLLFPDPLTTRSPGNSSENADGRQEK
ncbi:hypothetical protein GW742_25020 [Citrobacter freundii]|nr:hypothetical protein [Citrobacter freundii]MBC6509567.1 hypothetical protein [Citrobacter freundii]